MPASAPRSLLLSSRPAVLSDENLQRYARALYPVAIVLLFVPLVDVALRAFPPQFGTLQWRFATAGLILGNYGTVLLGAGLLGLTAALTGNRTVMRVLGFGALVMAAVTVALLLGFLLDAVQIRQLANPNFKRPILLSSAGAMFTGFLGTIAWITIGRSALAASRPAAAVVNRPVGRPAASPLVVGNAPPPVSAGVRESA